MIDVHAHLTRISNIDSIIDEALSNDVKVIITSTLSINEIDRALSLARKFNGKIYVTLGLEPTNLNLKDIEYIFQILKVRPREVVGIGEVGIDYVKLRDPILRELAKTLFTKWLSISKILNMPIIIHSRGAASSVVKLLIENQVKNAILHAFSGSLELVKRCVVEGYYFSIPPSINYSKQKQELVREVPLEQLLLESDTPELGPRPGAESRPVHVKLVAEIISKLKSVALNKVIEVTTENAIKLFNLNV